MPNLAKRTQFVFVFTDTYLFLVKVLHRWLPDPNEEAANSQALSTRQSIAVSALALANQS